MLAETLKQEWPELGAGLYKTPGKPDNDVSFIGISKKFRRGSEIFLALKDVNLRINSGEFVCIVGPSGCGKSTLLNMLAGLMEPSQGEVQMAGKSIEYPNTRVSYMTQKDTLMPWRTVWKNISLPLEIAGRPQAEIKDLVETMIRTVGLEGFDHSYPSQLSGGMRKRVILGRTLVHNPDVLLADEPFGALDAQLRMILQEELQRLWMETRKTILFVTHDIGEAVLLGDRVIVMSARPGEVKLDCRINLERPRNVHRISSQPEFTKHVEELWDALRHDVRSGEDV